MADTSTTTDDQPSVQRMVRTAASEFGTRPALALGDRVQSFVETHDRALRLANALTTLGLEPGARIALLATNGPWFAELYFAVCEAGMVEVPVNLRFTPSELESYLTKVRPDAILATADLALRARQIQEAVSSIRVAIGIGAGHGLPHDYDRILHSATPSELPLRDPDDTVLICSTSGTSGAAKAVQHTQRTTASGYRPLIERLGMDEQSHVVHGLPMYFATAYSGWTASFIAGAQQSMIPAFDPGAYVDLVEAVGGTHGLLGPAPVNYIMDAGIDLDRLSPLRVLSMGGAAVDPTRLEALVAALGTRVVVQYAMTEVAAATVLLGTEFANPDGTLGPLHRSVGRPLDGLAVRIVDANDDPLPFDGVARGELHLAGPLTTPGYLDDPVADAEAFDGDWLRTGDVAVVDADEHIFIVDRKKDLIVSGGINIAPNEVEAVIAQHPAVQSVGVCGVSDPVYGEAVLAAVVRMPGSELGEQDVVDWCTERLASVKKPRVVHFVEELPISSTGKLLRRELRDAYDDR